MVRVSVLPVPTILLFCVAVSVGCGGKSFPPGPTGKLTGQATIDGSPLPQGTTLNFIHIETRQPASAVVGPDGKYTAQMKGQFKVLAGGYQVGATDPAKPEMSEADLEKIYQGTEKFDSTPTVPMKYADPSSSGVVVQVDEGSDSPNDIKLTK